MMKRSLALWTAATLALLAAPVLPAADGQGWKDLFDGQSLAGWVQKGGKALYTVENGCILGQAVSNTPNSFLCTEKEYDNFQLELEFLVSPKLNSGVQIRSSCPDKPVEYSWKGKTIKVPAGRVHGYQVEIDPAKRAWSGGIYDEGRRGWLANLEGNDAARSAFKQGEWNRFRVECDGDSIKTWINGVPAASLKDSMTLKGIIALQVHGVGKNAAPDIQIRWRNLRIRELPASK